MLSSSRRVPRGPGRRRQSAKQAQFFRLLARWWTAAAARREVGISRSTSRNWRNGFKVYRDGVAVGFVPPIDRLTVSPISARFLSPQERIEIADLHRAGLGVRAIAAELGRSPSTVSRELRRNGRKDGQYRPFEAHHKAARPASSNTLAAVDHDTGPGGVLARAPAPVVEPHSRSAVNCACGSLTGQACICVRSRSTRPSTGPAAR